MGSRFYSTTKFYAYTSLRIALPNIFVVEKWMKTEKKACVKFLTRNLLLNFVFSCDTLQFWECRTSCRRLCWLFRFVKFTSEIFRSVDTSSDVGDKVEAFFYTQHFTSNGKRGIWWGLMFGKMKFIS